MRLPEANHRLMAEGCLDWYNETTMEENDDSMRDHSPDLTNPALPESHPITAPPLKKAGLGEKLLPFLIMGLVLGLDQLSKYLVETRIPLYGYWAPIPALDNFLRFTHTANTGAVFGLFQGTGMFFAALAVVVAGAI